MRLLCDNASEDIPHISIVPKRKLYENRAGKAIQVVRKLFPGYVLVETNYVLELFILTRHCEKLLRLIPSRNCFKEIDLEEIQTIIQMTDSEGIIDFSQIVINENHITVLSGPLLRYTGFVYKINRHKKRAKIKLNLNSNENLIDIGVDIFEQYDSNNNEHQIYFKQ